MSTSSFISDTVCDLKVQSRTHDTSSDSSSNAMLPTIVESKMSSGVKISGSQSNGHLSCHSVKTIAAGPLNSLQSQITKLSVANSKLRGKAKLELKEWKVKAGRAVEGIKQKVKEEVKQMELNERRSNLPGQLVSGRDDRCHQKSKQLVGGWVLTRQQMAYLTDQPYMYNASAGSYLELFCLQRFWLWLAQFIPSFIAPSVITVVGLAINLLCCACALYFAFDLRSDAPAWTFLLCSLGVFLYQTLDALDGKQSFKVQNSQIEEIYDHGCDAVSTVFVALAVAAAAQLAYYPSLLFIFFVLSVTAFYSTHWVAHVTHTMVFGKIDVSEGQWSMILIHFLTAVYGQRVWHTVVTTVFGYKLTIVHVLFTLTLVALCRSIFENIQMVMFKKETPLETLGVRIPRRNDVYSPLVPLFILISLTTCGYFSGLFELSPSVFMLTYGFSFAKLTMKLVMMNISRGNMYALDTSLVVPLLLALNSTLPRPLITEYTGLLCGLVYSMMDATRFFTYSSWDLRVALDANIFSIKYPAGHTKNRAGDNGFYINGLNNAKVLSEWNKFKENNGGLIEECFRH